MSYKEYESKLTELNMEYELRAGYLKKEWCIGGITGGSCWGGEPDTAVIGEPEPEFTELDELLEALCPSISFLQYKNLCSRLIKTSDYRSSDYYGNYTKYATKKIDLGELYNYLVEKELI